MSSAVAELESLLRARKLDVTLTSAAPWRRRTIDPDDLAPFGVAALDAVVDGGLRRGQLSEIVGARSSGRTAVLCAALAAATSRGEIVAVVDVADRFDPVSAEAAGVDLARLLWVRDTGNAARALKAMNLVLQAGGFGLVAFDVADVPAPALRAFPFTTWMRIARTIEGSTTVALLVAAERLARSPGGATIHLEMAQGPARVEWTGPSDRARLLTALTIKPRRAGC